MINLQILIIINVFMLYCIQAHLKSFISPLIYYDSNTERYHYAEYAEIYLDTISLSSGFQNI